MITARRPRVGTALRALPVSSRLAAFAAVASFVLVLLSAPSLTVRSLVGGLVAFAVPYLAIAVATRSASVGSKTFGAVLAALMTWLTSSSLPTFGSPVDLRTPAGATFLGIALAGAAVTASATIEAVLAAIRTRYWASTPWAARLALLTAGYLLVVFIADTYFSANPPLDRMLLVPGLAIAYFAASLMLRRPEEPARIAGAAAAVGAALLMLIYWAARPAYFPMGTAAPTVIGYDYYTLLPWPLLLAVTGVLGAAIAVLGVREVIRRDR